MAYVVASACIDVKDGDRQMACPVECIYEGWRMMYIHQDECHQLRPPPVGMPGTGDLR